MTAAVQALAYSPDGKTLATAGSETRDGTKRPIVRLWDAAGKEQKPLLPNGAEVLALVFVGDGKLLALGGRDSNVLLLDATTGQERGRLRGHLGWVNCLAATKDGKTLISGSYDETLKVWDPTPATERDTLRLHQGKEVYAVAFRPAGRGDKADQYLASAGADGTIKLWNLTVAKEAATLTGHQKSVLCLAFSADGKRLASGDADGTVRLWDTADPKSQDFGKEQFKLTGPTKAVLCVGFSEEDKEDKKQFLAMGSLDHGVYVWELGKLAKEAKTLAPILTANKGPNVHQGPVRNLIFLASTAGPILITSGDDKTVRLWDPKEGPVKEIQAGPAAVNALVLWPKSVMVVLGCADRLMRVQNVNKSSPSLVLRGQGSAVLAMAFAPDDASTLAVAGWDGTIKLWDPGQGSERLTLRGHTGPVSSLAFSDDQRFLASASYDGTVRLWRAAPRGSGSRMGHR